MDRLLRVGMPVASLAWLAAAGPPPALKPIPPWLVGNWEPVTVWQDRDVNYPVPEDQPKRWLAAAHLVVTGDSLTLAEYRCADATVTPAHGRPSVPIRLGASATIAKLELHMSDAPLDYLTVRCAHRLMRLRDEGPGYAHDFGEPVDWYVIVHSHDEIDMPFLSGSYVRFRKASPTS